MAAILAPSKGCPGAEVSPPPPPPPPPSRFPQIVPRDGVGGRETTETDAKAKLQKPRTGDPSPEPGDWRLPHAPVPFRPDYSRVVPPARERTKIGEMTARAIAAEPGCTKKTEYRREESSAQTILNSLRDNRTLGLLGHVGAHLNQVERECSQTTYLPFTFTTPANNQTLGEQTKNKRERGGGGGGGGGAGGEEYVFPGFCSGCQRTNALSFCYGCERDSGPHYHVDKTGRTGGGFTYIRRDRPLCQTVGKNPVNWRTMLTNIPYIYYNGMFVPSLEKYGVALHVEGLDRRLHLLTEDLAVRLGRLRTLGSREASSQLLLPDQLCALLSIDGDNLTATPVYGADNGEDEEEEEEEDEEEEEEGDGEGEGEASFELEDSDVDSGRGGTIIDSQDGRWKSRRLRPRRAVKDSDDAVRQKEPDLEAEHTNEPVSEKKQLYQAPKAFQLKKREGKATMPKSPFSKDRQLNIPKYKAVEIRKSEKKTEFIDINLGDATWKTPPPFQLKKGEDNKKERLASVGGRLSALAEEEGSNDDADKQIQSESQPKNMPRISEERSAASPDSGVGSVKLSPAGQTGTQQRMGSKEKALQKSHNGLKPVASKKKNAKSNHAAGTVGTAGATSVSGTVSGTGSERPVVVPTGDGSDIVSGDHERDREIRQSAVALPTVAEKFEKFEEEEEGEEGEASASASSSTSPSVAAEAATTVTPTVVEDVDEKEMSSPTRRRKSSPVVIQTQLEDHDDRSNDNAAEPMTSEDQFERELRSGQRSREIAKKEREQEPRRVRRKSARGGEGEGEGEGEESPGESRGGSVSPDEGLVVFDEPSIPEIDHLSRLPDPLPLPKIEPPYPPKMMEFIEPVKPRRELGTTEVESPPPMVEPPRQKPPPLAVKEKRKSRRASRPVTLRARFGAPVAVADLKDIVDPLDWLAKYCIIHPDRLPHYLRVFNKTASDQAYRYSDVPLPDGNLPDGNLPDGHATNNQDSIPSPTRISKQDGASSSPGGPDWPRSHQQGPWSAAGPVADRTASGHHREKLGTQKTRLTEDERQNLRDYGVVGVCLKPEYGSSGKSEGDLAIDKINYTLDVLIDKYEDLQEKLDNYTAEKVKILVELTRKHFPDLANPKYKQKSKQKTKKAKNEKKEQKEEEEDGDKHGHHLGVVAGPEQTDQTNRETLEQRSPEEPKPFGDLDVIARLEEKHLKAFSSDPDLQRLNRDIARLKEKLKDADDRIDDLEDEKKLLQLYARDEYLQSQTTNAKPEKFLRKQSPLYQKMHPTTNVEMNLTELEEALRQINGQLITQKELQYIFFILNIPGRRRIDVQLFSVVAALSEKVAQVDPFIRKLINKFDFEALNIKMDRSKELFSLLVGDEADVPLGKIAAQRLGVELAAGGVSEEHTGYVLSKFNRDNKGVVDFLDFLTYIPLFIEVHDRILDCPLGLERSW